MFSIGPGFFIFFHDIGIQAGSGNPVIFVSRRDEKKEKRKIEKKIIFVKKQLKEQSKPVSKEAIKRITKQMVKQWNPKPAINKFNIEYDEALKRYIDYVESMIKTNEDEDMAFLLILANI